MAKTEPIRDLNDIELFKRLFLNQKRYRNFALFILGINTALRISDILVLKWKDVYDFKKKKYKKHINIIEKKTKNKIAINTNIIEALELLYHIENTREPELYLLQSRINGNYAISRNRAFHIIKDAANELGIEGTISCHSLRKTFGYQAWKRGIPPAILMSIYNHSSMEITKLYLCIDQDDKDDVFLNMCL